MGAVVRTLNKTRGKLQVCDMDYSTYFKDMEENIIGLWEAIR